MQEATWSRLAADAIARARIRTTVPLALPAPPIYVPKPLDSQGRQLMCPAAGENAQVH